MTPDDIVRSIVAAGGSIRVLGDGRASLCGDLAPEIVEQVRERREEVIRAWEVYERDRYFRPPPQTLPLRRKPPELNRSSRARVQAYVMNQEGEVALWALLRATQYQEAFPAWPEGACATAACCDVLHWQLERHPAPTTVIVDLEEGANDFVQQTTKP